MPTQGLLVSLSGIDGTGKSTVAHQLCDILSSDFDMACRKVWCKFGNHPLSRFRLARLFDRGQAGGSYSIPSGGKQSSMVLTLYGFFLLAFHLLQILFAVWKPVRRGQAVVCDRYIFDTMVDLQQELYFPMSRVRSIFDAKWIPQPDHKFLLDLEETVAFERKTDTASVGYLQKRRAMYRSIACEYGLTCIDASQPIEAVVRSVIGQIKESNLQDTGTG